MTEINGMPITDNLANFLKASIDKGSVSQFSTDFDIHVESLIKLNDYLVHDLSEISLNDTEQVRAISGHLVDLKYAKDDLKKLSELLKECSQNMISK